jgi:hypothetical protein
MAAVATVATLALSAGVDRQHRVDACLGRSVSAYATDAIPRGYVSGVAAGLAVPGDCAALLQGRR